MNEKAKAHVVSRLQMAAFDAFMAVSKSFQEGLSEAAIAKMVRREFEKCGITEHWYDVPIHTSIGTERFVISTTTTDYAIKRPQEDVFLAAGDVMHIDTSPMDPATKLWGDWSTTVVFLPREEKDREQVEFLQEFRNLHLAGILNITANTTGAEIAAHYIDAFQKRGITLLDVRNNVGHSIHSGSKADAKRIWLDLDNDQPLGEGIFTIEPGGCRDKRNGDGIVVARFEECIYIPPEGSAQILGYAKTAPLAVMDR